MQYQSFYHQSLNEPESFWKTQAQELNWFSAPTKILTPQPNGYYRWFEDGTLNMSHLCIDTHIEAGHGDQVAIIYESPVTQTQQKITYQELYEEVNALAKGLQDLGYKKGDTAIVYMPMIPQALYSMLACARLGIIHSVVFGGFASNELAIRIDDCKASFIITASCGIEINRKIAYKPLVDEALEIASHKVDKVILYDRNLEVDFSMKEGRDEYYKDILQIGAEVTPISVESYHPLYILYTSGTTGKPKGIVRDTGGYATALKFSMKYVYGVESGDTYWAASDVGWVVGHSYIVYGPLLHRNTTVLFEGKPIKTPDASTFWRIISEHQVKVMFTAPTAIRAIRKEDPEGNFINQYDLSHLKYQFLAGERCDASTLHWLKEKLQIPVIDHWWQTESGWPMIANMVGVEEFPVKPGSATFPVCGYDVQILTQEGTQASPNEEGLVCVQLPLPPGALMTIWNDDERFINNYLSTFPGYYLAGDGGYQDEESYFFITGRIDDVINVAGHRLSTSDMEEIVAAHQEVAECAVFGVEDALKGQVPLALIVLNNDRQSSLELIQEELIQEVRNKIGAVASLKRIIAVERLPKTRSGKILRKLLRQIADQKEIVMPSTIDDPNIIQEIQNQIHSKK